MNEQHTAVPPYTPVFLSYPELFTFLNISTVNCSVYKRFLLFNYQLFVFLTVPTSTYIFSIVYLMGTVCIPNCYHYQLFVLPIFFSKLTLFVQFAFLTTYIFFKVDLICTVCIPNYLYFFFKVDLICTVCIPISYYLIFLRCTIGIPYL